MRRSRLLCAALVAWPMLSHGQHWLLRKAPSQWRNRKRPDNSGHVAYGKRPNIIFILTDDLGYGDIGVFYQNQRAAKGEPCEFTPHLDAMAAEGIQLRDHYTSAQVRLRGGRCWPAFIREMPACATTSSIRPWRTTTRWPRC